jgi:hypothetical protein
MVKVGTLYTSLGGRFELSFIMIEVQIHANLEGYFKLSFIMIEMNNLNTNLVGYFEYHS